jgi:hypothetical protein
MTILKTVLLAGVIAMSAASAQAATVWTDTVANRPGMAVINVNGEMVRGDTVRLINEWKKLPKDTHIIVSLASLGGDAEVGVNMGEAIRLIGAHTLAVGACASSCSIAWLGGTYREIYKNSSIGFHSTSIEMNGVRTVSPHGNAMWSSYLAELGFGPQVANYITATPPGGITWLTEVNAKALGIQAEWLRA